MAVKVQLIEEAERTLLEIRIDLTPRDTVDRAQARTGVQLGGAEIPPEVIVTILTGEGVVEKRLRPAEALLPQPPHDAFEDLTSQERRVLGYVAEGKTNREIAQLMDRSDGTVRNYVSAIMRKLGVTNRTAAAAYAIKCGIWQTLEGAAPPQVIPAALDPQFG